MRLPTFSKSKHGFVIAAFGFRIHLWNESEVEWCATIFDGEQELSNRFEEDNLPLAKLHTLADARYRATVKWKDREFPSCESLFDSWESMTFVDES
jgi:hypothetical protein